jgi:hypothetical protein
LFGGVVTSPKRTNTFPDIESPHVDNRSLLVYMVKAMYEMREDQADMRKEIAEHLTVHRLLAKLLWIGIPSMLTIAGLFEAWLFRSK